MAIKTNTATLSKLTLTSDGNSTSLTKEQLDELLARIGSSTTSQFTEDEANVLKKLAKMTAIKNLVTSTQQPTFIMRSQTLAGVEQVTADPQKQENNTFYIVSGKG